MNKRQTFFFKHVQQINSCWLWIAATDEDGYARFWTGSKKIRGHRFSYQLFRGPIPKNLCIDHLCRNRRCVNPWHLEIVTLRENIMRGNGIGVQSARKTHCPRGHVYDHITKRGFRICRPCDNLSHRKMLG